MVQKILSYYEAATMRPSVVGGKGWNIGRLHRYGFSVPVGGVLVADVYSQLTGTPDLRLLQTELIDIEDIWSARMIDKLATMRSLIELAEFPDGLVDQLQAFLLESGLANMQLAVRSSATTEDSALASFAGIHQSFLNISGIQQILKAIKGCYASLWTPQAIAYRRHHGFSDNAVSCAVVLCAMILALDNVPLIAGVAFSSDPQTGRRDQLIINAVCGSSEAMTSGKVNAEDIRVTLYKGKPTYVLHGSGDYNLLNHERILELAHLIQRIQWALGDGQDPQDVEWTFDGQRFWILQSRPLTILPRRTFREVSQMPIIWSNANLKDAVPEILSTLSWSSLYDGFHAFLYIGGRSRWPEGMEMIRRFNGRAYLDLTSLMWYAYDTFGLTPQHVSQVLGGHQPKIPIPPSDPLSGIQGMRRIGTRLGLLLGALKMAWTYAGETRRTHTAIDKLKSVDWKCLSNADLLAASVQVASLVERFVLYGMANNMVIWDQILLKVLNYLRPERGSALTSALMAGADGVVSAEHGYRLYELAMIAQRELQAQRYLESQPFDPAGWYQLPEDSPFRKAFIAFLEEYGHRALYEVDIANPRWNEEQSYLLEQVRFFLTQDLSQPPRSSAHSVGKTAEAEVTQLPILARPVIRWLVQQSRQAAKAREIGKYTFVKLLEPLRYMALEVGRRMVAEGKMKHANEVFYLSKVEIEAYLRGDWNGQGARELASDRLNQRAIWLTEASPDILITDVQGYLYPSPGDSVIISTEVPGKSSTNPSELDERGIVLRGVGASSGRAAGPARIIHHPSDSSRLQTGDILVAPSTDPGWTPLFLRSAAVVTQVGGYLSHGAIVAREYGIPSVVNVPGLLETIADGQQLIVDGDSGKITLSN